MNRDKTIDINKKVDRRAKELDNIANPLGGLDLDLDFKPVQPTEPSPFDQPGSGLDLDFSIDDTLEERGERTALEGLSPTDDQMLRFTEAGFEPEGFTQVDEEQYMRIFMLRGYTPKMAKRIADWQQQRGGIFVNSMGLGDTLGKAAKNMKSSWVETAQETFNVENFKVIWPLAKEMRTFALSPKDYLNMSREKYPLLKGLIDFYAGHYNIFDEAGRQVFYNYVAHKPSEFLSDALAVLLLGTKALAVTGISARTAALANRLNFSKYARPLNSVNIPDWAKTTAKHAGKAFMDPGELAGSAADAAKGIRGIVEGANPVTPPGLNFKEHAASDVLMAETRINNSGVLGGDQLVTPRSVVTGSLPGQQQMGRLYKTAPSRRVRKIIDDFNLTLNKAADGVVERIGSAPDAIELGNRLAFAVTDVAGSSKQFRRAYGRSLDALLGNAEKGIDGVMPGLLEMNVDSPFDNVIAVIDSYLSPRMGTPKQIGIDPNMVPLSDLKARLESINETGTTIADLKITRTSWGDAKNIRIGDVQINLPPSKAIQDRIYKALGDDLYAGLESIDPDIAADFRELNSLYAAHKDRVGEALAGKIEKLVNQGVSEKQIADLLLRDEFVTGGALDKVIDLLNPRMPEVVVRPSAKNTGKADYELVIDRPASNWSPTLSSYYMRGLIDKARNKAGIVTAEGLQRELGKRSRASHEKIMTADGYDTLEDMLTILEQAQQTNKVLTNSETFFNQLSASRMMGAADTATNAAEMIGRMALTGGFQVDLHTISRAVSQAVGLLVWYGEDFYVAMRETKRPDLPSIDRVKAFMEKREKAAQRGWKAWGAAKVGARVSRRPIIRAKMEQELERELYGH